MPDFEYLPPINGAPTQPFLQQLILREEGRVIGTARWYVPVGKDGVVQILDLAIQPEHRRKGNGSALLLAIKQQAVSYGQASAHPTRRLWISIEQKTQINARAFLTRHGFHHVATLKELLDDQDALVYLLALD
jgi:ribosomal protein S18 acetylase RimI-like enzyme